MSAPRAPTLSVVAALAALSLLLVTGCSASPGSPTGPQDGGAAPGPDGSSGIDFPDGGARDASAAGADGGEAQGTIKVTCTGPSAPIRLNTGVALDCAIDSGGSPVKPPTFSAQPSDGVSLRDQGNGRVIFSLSTGTAGYRHPVGFTDTTYKVTLEVHDASNAAIFGRGSVSVTVLGNLWTGDHSSTGQGIHSLGSDGTFVGQAVGPGGITGVFDLRALPGGDVVASSYSSQSIKIFDRQGREQPVVFENIDLNGAKLWDPSATASYGAAPRQMALSSINELWVAGAAVNKIPGVAIFNPSNGRFLRFLPSQDATQTSVFEGIGRREDGTMLLGSSGSRKIHLWDEKTYAAKGAPNVDPGSFGGYVTFLPLPGGDLLTAMSGGSDATLVIFNPTFAVQNKTADLYQLRFFGAAISGDEYLFPDSYGFSSEIIRFDRNLKMISPNYNLKKSVGLRGIVKLKGS